jgi:two-component system, NtrC family, sensor kinase
MPDEKKKHGPSCETASPRVDEPFQAEASTMTAQRSTISGLKTILLVDDRLDARYTMYRALVSAGFDVLEAATGRDALKLARLSPDAIVLDIELGDLDGFEVVRRLKASPATQHIPVLHKTAVFCDGEHRRRGLAAGADEYLMEPFEPQALIETVQRLLDRGAG